MLSLLEQVTALLSAAKGEVFAKRLSKNDQSWSDDPEKHQSGPYIPQAIRASGFFPALVQRADKPHIFETTIRTEWPQVVDIDGRMSRLVHYSNKGSETHLTRVPRLVFAGLPPASLLICARIDEVPCWRFIIVPSGTSDFEDVEELLDLSPAFESGILTPPRKGADEALAAEILEALQRDFLSEFISASALDDGQIFAGEAQAMCLRETGFGSFSASETGYSGDIVRKLCDLQYRNFAQKEKRLRAAQLVRTLARVHPKLSDARETVRSVVFAFPELLELFKSLRGARASRMGKAFEYHLRRVLEDSGVPFSFQPRIGGRTPDFVLPSASSVDSLKGSATPALTLSAKSTLRERWQQILNEVATDQVFLVTLDPAITASSIADMKKANVTLVAPEAFVECKGAYYYGSDNVMSFQQFIDGVVRPRLSGWASAAA